MKEKEQLVSRSEEELFGPEGYKTDPFGAERFCMVASDLEVVANRLLGTGFELLSANPDFHLIIRENAVAFALHRFYGENRGLWILERDVENYSMIVGVEPEAVELGKEHL